ncbi:MAG TPA: replication-associated recombination protein A [Gemmatimonadales bacterium]|nr:replication-associated recombination protein A [Gemmatimonadales bacterium]
MSAMKRRGASGASGAGGGDETSLFAAADTVKPLAARMRPRTLDEYVGQRHLLAPGKPLREAIERDRVGSMLFWGPPGTGKTTLAHLIARSTHRTFVPFSAVTEGVPRLREIFAEARERLATGGGRTVLFVDEIHRLNKAQQDTLLPAVEEGLVTLIGATTENPSFEVNGALLSRTRVFVLQSLAPDDIAELVRRAASDGERGLGTMRLAIEPDALALIAEEADGDARRALTVLEAAATHVGTGGTVTVEAAREAMQLRFARHDKAGEEHFNILSAYHKSLRGSDPQGALYWMARMLDGGEDPMTIFRRAIAMAAEDIGLADPNALPLAVAARDAYHMLGAPEGYLPLAEMTIYLATAPKSNSAKRALDAALEAARQTPAAPVPLHIRNAPTALMRELGYHAGYRYAHDAPEAYLPQDYLPDQLKDATFYTPGAFGYEKRVAERLAWWAKLRREAEREAGGEAGAGPGAGEGQD